MAGCEVRVSGAGAGSARELLRYLSGAGVEAIGVASGLPSARERAVAVFICLWG